MGNLGFSRLHIVAPRHLELNKAKRTACWAEEILDQAIIHTSLEDALGPMHDVIGFTSAYGGNRLNHQTLFQWSGGIDFKGDNEVALLFGPEDTGLRREHIPHCRALVRIPSVAENPSYNLSQAVLLVLFELVRAAEIPTGEVEQRNSASWNELYQLDRMIENVADINGFYRDGSPAGVPDVIKQLMRRIAPDKREVGILLALFARIANHSRRVPAATSS